VNSGRGRGNRLGLPFRGAESEAHSSPILSPSRQLAITLFSCASYFFDLLLRSEKILIALMLLVASKEKQYEAARPSATPPGARSNH
jgi:hypothetical protein